MKTNNEKIGFIGAGLMGYGMAHNLLKKGNSLSVIAHKNRRPIEMLISEGANESHSFEDLANISDIIIMCVTNTTVALEVVKKILPYLKSKSLFIDITTHHSLGSIQVNNLLRKKNIRYVESPVMGGPVQSKEGILGAIVGSSVDNYCTAKKILMHFCQNVFHFGDIGMGSKTKLVNNFLSLGTATLVIETLKAAKHLNIDMQKLLNVAKLGSGSSASLTRIAEKSIKGDNKGYIFTVENALKDLTYINDLLKDLPNSKKLSSLIKSIYEDASNKGNGKLFISELIDK